MLRKIETRNSAVGSTVYSFFKKKKKKVHNLETTLWKRSAKVFSLFSFARNNFREKTGTSWWDFGLGLLGGEEVENFGGFEFGHVFNFGWVGFLYFSPLLNFPLLFSPSKPI